MQCETGSRATMWHAGTKSYYEVTVVRRMTADEVLIDLMQEEPRPDEERIREITQQLNRRRGVEK